MVSKKDLKVILRMLLCCGFMFTCDIGTALVGQHMNAFETAKYFATEGNTGAVLYAVISIIVSAISLLMLLVYVILMVVDAKYVRQIEENNRKIRGIVE